MPLRSDSENFALIRVIGVGGGGSNAVRAVIHGGDAVSQRLQIVGNEPAQLPVIVDDENFVCIGIGHGGKWRGWP